MVAQTTEWLGRRAGAVSVPPPTTVDAAPAVEVGDLPAYTPGAYAGQTNFASYDNTIYDGGKFSGGFGETQLYELDYWTLRQRSSQLFTENLYARGLIRRLVTNEINTGLTPEACPYEEGIGVEEDSLVEWTETIESRFTLWAKSPRVCDYRGQMTFGAIQRAARREALVAGDVLVVLRQNASTRMPSVQLVKGDAVMTPTSTSRTRLRKGHTIDHGVERNKSREQVAYWVLQDDGSFKRLPAFGEKSGRRMAWLVYGCDKRLDEVRGTPLLSLVLQSLKEIDRYRDSAQRKAVVNSILAMFIRKTEDKMGTLPMTGGAVRKGEVTTQTTSDGPRRHTIAEHVPGVVMEELQVGEEPVGFHSQGTDINFGVFEEAIVQAIAWANEMPPEILRLAFSNNYSASQAAINEFKIYLNRVWGEFGEEFCSPIYVDWMVSEALLGKIKAPGMLRAWRLPQMFDVFAAWTMVDWYGSIKPSTDMLKQAKGSELLVRNAWSTHAREARVTTGTKFTKNVKRLKRENQLLVEAERPLAEFRQEFGISPDEPNTQANVEDAVDAIEAAIEDGTDQ